MYLLGYLNQYIDQSIGGCIDHYSIDTQPTYDQHVNQLATESRPMYMYMSSFHWWLTCGSHDSQVKNVTSTDESVDLLIELS